MIPGGSRWLTSDLSHPVDHVSTLLTNHLSFISLQSQEYGRCFGANNKSNSKA